MTDEASKLADELEARIRRGSLVATDNLLEDILTALRSDAQLKALQNHVGRLEERAALRGAERLLMLHDTEINDIVQRRLERGKWFIGSEGFVRSTALEQHND